MLGTSHGAMDRKRLITDSFQVVKKKRGRKERKEAQSPPQDLVQAESHLQDTAPSDQLEILKQFDLSWQYGPCTGITRMQRWERAKFLGLNPPTTVWDLLLKYNKDPFVMNSCFSAVGVSTLSPLNIKETMTNSRSPRYGLPLLPFREFIPLLLGFGQERASFES
ncbi:DNA polymerase delta subunit 4 isoform X2 [Crotalus tigris]|nr:DNA polymerase delta subunit 4 isoform X2 [Crotalus tigris]XP_039196981.1 DNA polymerase delta subunit 4 isoform X2 [Crotalus tigris]XP_039196982.1 DNA polymerase delta subunit 4 isoform X2 [Crotalus tigris]